MKKIILLLAVIAALFSSCKSTKAFQGNANLSFLILDQNDRPVEDYELTLFYQRKVLEDFEESASSQTNGICLFYNIPSSLYTLSGKKNGYTKIMPQDFNFTRPDELFCYRVFSYDYVFDQTNQYFNTGQYQKALNLLENLCVEQDPYLQNTLSFYTAYAYAKLGQKEKADLQLQNIVESEDPAFQTLKYRQVIEGMLIND